MAAQRKFEIVWLGDTKSFDRSLDNVNKGVGKSEGKFKKFGKAAAIGLGGGLVAAGAAMKSFAEQAMESEKSQARMETQLKALGIDYGKHAGQIDEVIQKHSRLAGLDDEELQDSFTNIVRVTGDVNKALKLNGLAADFARAKGMDVAKAGELIGKVAGGNTGILSRYGIQLEKGATAQEALATLQKKFAGQAKAYGETAGGAQDRFRVAVENLQEAFGKKLLPIISKVVMAVSGFIEEIQNGTGAGGRFIKWVREAAADIAAFAGKVDDALGISKVVWPAIVKLIESLATTVRGVVNVIKGIIDGDFSLVWDGAKKIVSGTWDAIKTVISVAVHAIVTVVKTVLGGLLGVVRDIFEGIADKIRDVWRNIRDFIGNRIDDIVGAVAAIPGRLAQISGNLFEKVKDGMRAAWDFVRDRAGDIVGAIVGLPGRIAAYSGNFFEKIKDGIAAAKDAVVERVVQIVGAVQSIPGLLTAWLSKAGKFFVGVGQAIARSIRTGLGDLADWIADAITSPLKKVAGFAIKKAQGGFVPFGQIAQVGELGRENIMPVPGGVVIEQASQSGGGGAGGGNVYIDKYVAHNDSDAATLARELGWRLATG